MKHKEIIDIASTHLSHMNGSIMDVVDITKPPTLDYARHLAKTVSKLSPMVGNMIEYQVCLELNKLDWKGLGSWQRQDPGFPDTVFNSTIKPQPGIEIKTWFPLATEMTARFKDSVNFFDSDQTNVAVVAWIPEFIIFGRPKIIDVWVGSAKSLAQARDKHYHNPPDYLVFEPEDTSSRTSNLQQTNTNGYKFQGNAKELKKAEALAKKWGKSWNVYSSKPIYQKKIKELLGTFTYRSDTNFAKIDRIQHKDLENFKTKVLAQKLFGHDIKTWSNIIGDEEQDIVKLLKDLIEVAKQ